MSIINKVGTLEQTRELKNSLDELANQLIWIERRYIVKVNEHIIQKVQQQEKEIIKVHTIIKVIQSSREVRSLKL